LKVVSGRPCVRASLTVPTFWPMETRSWIYVVLSCQVCGDLLVSNR
jgi:hypothetical protein